MLYVQIYYEVDSGDTFSEIAMKFKMNIVGLRILNPIFDKEMGRGGKDINSIQVGELIRIQ
jgi:hypothetical protein